jgi:hypothetical protein
MIEQHGHYCGWLIKWKTRSSGHSDFWIEREYPRVKPSTVLIEYHLVGSFADAEKGYEKTKELIDLLFAEARTSAHLTIVFFRTKEDLYTDSMDLQSITDSDIEE